MIYRTERACRACGSSALETLLDLGDTPLADRLVRVENANTPDPIVALTLARCDSCTLVQILETVAPEELFCRDYPYYSSVSPSLLEHFRSSAIDIIEKRALGKNSLVVEAASNDGYMLRNFVTHGCSVIGIDPASGPAQAALEAGVTTINDFFSADLARQLLHDQGRPADVFLANNVLAHVADLGGFVDGIHDLLAEDGVAVIEAPYLVDLVDHAEFDTIYHQHLCYFSVTALDALLRRHDLYLNDVVRTTIHGGSLRLFIERRDAPQTSVAQLIAEEERRGFRDGSRLRDFAARVAGLRTSLRALLDEQVRAGKRIVGYAAAAKATTLMSYCGIGTDDIAYIADKNPHKHGRLTPGNRIPIVAPERILEDRPDFVLILAWNFADEIRAQLSEFERGGGRFIVPVPSPRILT